MCRRTCTEWGQWGSQLHKAGRSAGDDHYDQFDDHNYDNFDHNEDFSYCGHYE